MKEEISESNYHYLVLKYPGIKHFIKSCFDKNEHRKIIDFIFAIETDDITANCGH